MHKHVALPPQPLKAGFALDAMLPKTAPIPLAYRFFICLLAGVSLSVLADDLPPVSARVVGGDSEYTVQSGDFLIAIGARFGVPAELVAQQNALPFNALIRPGLRLHIHNPHIVPAGFDDGILINLPQGMLFNFSQGALVSAYPVGLGKPSWPTPEGEFKIVSRVANKTWLVPKSIQEEMRREGKAVLEEVPPGPDNPLGKHWLGLSLWGYGIHGTIAPSSVYHFRSHGCIRLHPDDIAELFKQVRVGITGRLIYQPVLLAVIKDGRILLEVHQDIYKRGIDPAQTVRDLAQANGLSQAIDWPKVDAVIAAQDGLAREVGHLTGNGSKGEP
jgi:L,D-transpeptidase ErfK/SrfK